MSTGCSCSHVQLVFGRWLGMIKVFLQLFHHEIGIVPLMDQELLLFIKNLVVQKFQRPVLGFMIMK